MSIDAQEGGGRTRFGGWRSVTTRLTSLADQVLYSSVSLLQVAIYARLFDKEEFGVFSLAVGISLVLVGIQRSAIIIPAIVLFPTPEAFTGSGRWARVHLMVVAAVTLTLLLLGAAADALGREPLGRLGMLAAVLTAGALLFDYQRRSLYQLCKGRSALLVSAVYLASSAIGFVAVALWATNAIGAVIAASAAATLAAFLARTLRGPLAIGEPARRSARDVRGTVVWNALSFLPYMAYNHGMVLFVGVIAGPVTAGIFAATRVFVAPVQLLTAAIDNTDKPRTSRALASSGAAAFKASLGNTSATLLVLGLPYLLAVAIEPEFFGMLLLGPTYAPDMWIARIWAVVGVLLLLGQPLESGLVILGRSDWLFACRCLAAMASLGGTAMLMTTYGASGAVAALAIAWLASTVQAAIVLARHTRELNE